MEHTEIRRWLKYGDRQLIARICNCHRFSVSRAINKGFSTRSKILLVAEQVAQKRKQEHLEEIERSLNTNNTDTHK